MDGENSTLELWRNQPAEDLLFGKGEMMANLMKGVGVTTELIIKVGIAVVVGYAVLVISLKIMKEIQQKVR